MVSAVSSRLFCNEEIVEFVKFSICRSVKKERSETEEKSRKNEGDVYYNVY